MDICKSKRKIFFGFWSIEKCIKKTQKYQNVLFHLFLEASVGFFCSIIVHLFFVWKTKLQYIVFLFNVRDYDSERIQFGRSVYYYLLKWEPVTEYQYYQYIINILLVQKCLFDSNNTTTTAQSIGNTSS